MMSFLKNLFTPARPVPKPSRIYRLPDDWMPAAAMKRVIIHWTAGSYIASETDREHYHFLVEGDLDVVRGKHPITANISVSGKSPDNYAAHTRNCNTGSIGVSICASAGANESPYNPGRAPLTEIQWQRAAEVVASLCRRYNIAVTDRTVLTHAEVQPNLGITQAGKWDVTRLPWDSSIKGAKACGDDFRARVKSYL